MRHRPFQPKWITRSAATVACLAVLLLAGCTAGSWATSAASFDTCELPCWQGITPHRTSVSQASATLQRLYSEEQVSRVGEIIVWQAEDGSVGHLATSDGLAGTIMLEFPEGMLTVGALIQQIGPPDIVHVTLPHPSHSPDPANPQCDVLQLRYPDQKLEVRVYDSRSGQVEDQQSVYRLYLAPERPELTIQTPYYAREWTGYGTYCIAVDELFE